jgi:hypothetical protein
MVGHVVAVGKEHPAESAELLDALDQRARGPGRVDEHVAAFPDDERAGGAERALGGEAAVMNAVQDALGEGPYEPIEAAELLAWLASERNGHMTGQTIFLDGGADVALRGDSTW